MKLCWDNWYKPNWFYLKHFLRRKFLFIDESVVECYQWCIETACTPGRKVFTQFNHKSCSEAKETLKNCSDSPVVGKLYKAELQSWVKWKSVSWDDYGMYWWTKHTQNLKRVYHTKYVCLPGLPTAADSSWNESRQCYIEFEFFFTKAWTIWR